MATAEEIIRLKEFRDKVELQLEEALGRIAPLLDQDSAITNKDIHDASEGETVATDEFIVNKRDLKIVKREKGDEKEVEAVAEAKGNRAEAQAAKQAENATGQEESLDKGAEKAALVERKEENELKKELKKKEEALAEMKKLVERAKEICRVQTEKRKFGQKIPWYEARDNRKELNEIIAKITEENDLIIKHEGQIRELHRLLTSGEIKFNELEATRRSLASRARVAIETAEGKKAA